MKTVFSRTETAVFEFDRSDLKEPLLECEQISKRRRLKMAKHIRLPHQTPAELGQDDEFQKFFKGFLEHLQKKLIVREVKGKRYSYKYHTCGQQHDYRNPNWKPFQHLEWYCEKTRFDFLTVKSIIEDQIGRKLQCECDLLRDDQARRKLELKSMYGVDFGELGMKELDIV